MYKEFSFEKQIEIINRIRKDSNLIFISFDNMLEHIKLLTEEYSKYLGYIRNDKDEITIELENMSFVVIYTKYDKSSYKISFVCL